MRMDRYVVALGILGIGVATGGCGGGTRVLHVRTSDGFTIAAEVRLPPSQYRPAPLVVLGHQLGSDRHSWDSLVPRLLGAGYAVVTVDHRGFGESVRDAASPAALSRNARDHLELDLLAALRFAARREGVDATRVAVIGTGISATGAVRCAREESSVRALVVLVGPLEVDAEEFLLDTPELPVLLVAAAGDERGVALMRQYGARFTGPAQEYVELGPVSADDAAEWRGTDGLASDTGLADLLLWFLERNFPVHDVADSSNAPTPSTAGAVHRGG